VSLSIRTLRRGFRQSVSQSVSQLLTSVPIGELRSLYKHQRLTQQYTRVLLCLTVLQRQCRCAEMSVLVCHIVTSLCCRALC